MINISLLTLIGIALIFLCFGLLIAYTSLWLKNPWLGPRIITFKPGLAEIKRLEALYDLLNRIASWLNITSHSMAMMTVDRIWELQYFVQLEIYYCQVLFSTDVGDRLHIIHLLAEAAANKTQALMAVHAIYNDMPKKGAFYFEVKDLLLTKGFIDDENHLSSSVNNLPNSSKYLYRKDNHNMKKHGSPDKVGQIVGQINAKVVTLNSGELHQGDIMVSEDIGPGLSQLIKELATLRGEMKKMARGPIQDASIGSIASAELEAKGGNKKKALEHLAKAGEWALTVATKIGASVAAAAIKEALKIP
jgi:hypothetical protein